MSSVCPALVSFHIIVILFCFLIQKTERPDDKWKDVIILHRKREKQWIHYIFLVIVPKGKVRKMFFSGKRS